MPHTKLAAHRLLGVPSQPLRLARRALIPLVIHVAVDHAHEVCERLMSSARQMLRHQVRGIRKRRDLLDGHLLVAHEVL
eukprot:1814614-Heterocapsa_arctica.AAC.1